MSLERYLSLANLFGIPCVLVAVPVVVGFAGGMGRGRRIWVVKHGQLSEKPVLHRINRFGLRIESLQGGSDGIKCGVFYLDLTKISSIFHKKPLIKKMKGVYWP